MFSGFYIELDEKSLSSNCLQYYRKIGVSHLREEKRKYDKTLKRYLKEQVLSASSIGQDWFPEIDVDVFLSHSRGDKKLVEALAGWLHEIFGLRCFLDSNVWNHSSSLLSLLNNRYSNPETRGKHTYYSHEECILVSEHVNMILAIALQNMIDRAESLFFVNAGNGARFAIGESLSTTYSPWIYAEISYANMIQKKPLIAYRSYGNRLQEECQRSDSEVLLECLQIAYPINLMQFERLNEEKLYDWMFQYKFGSYKYALDALYEQTQYASTLAQTKEQSLRMTDEQLSQVHQLFSDSLLEKEDNSIRPIFEAWNERCMRAEEKCPKYNGCKRCLLYN